MYSAITLKQFGYTELKSRYDGGVSILPRSSRAGELSKHLELALKEKKKLREDYVDLSGHELGINIVFCFSKLSSF